MSRFIASLINITLTLTLAFSLSATAQQEDPEDNTPSPLDVEGVETPKSTDKEPCTDCEDARQALLNTIDPDCFIFDSSAKYTNSEQMMKNCTELFKKIPNRAGLKWAFVYFHRNGGLIEDPSCLKAGAPVSHKKEIINKGIQNRCHILFNDFSDLCMDGKFRKGSYIQAKFLDLCTTNSKNILTAFLMKADKDTCKLEFADAMGATSPGAYVTRGRQGNKLLLAGMNESNNDSFEKKSLQLSTAYLKKLTSKMSLVVNLGPERFHQDPSVCKNGESKKPKKK